MNFKRLDDALHNLWGVMPIHASGIVDDDVAELYRAVLSAIRDLKAQVSRGSPGGDNGPAPANRPEPTPRPPEAGIRRLVYMWRARKVARAARKNAVPSVMPEGPPPPMPEPPSRLPEPKI